MVASDLARMPTAPPPAEDSSLVPIQVNVAPQVRRDLKELAHTHRISLSAMTRRAVEEWLVAQQETTIDEQR